MFCAALNLTNQVQDNCEAPVEYSGLKSWFRRAFIQAETYCGICGRLWGNCVCPGGPTMPSPGSEQMLPEIVTEEVVL